MIDLSDYRYWYKKALAEIMPGGFSHLAIEYLKNCLKLNPDHIDSWILYAKILVIFFEFIKVGLEKAEIHKKLEEDFDDMQIMHHFKIDNEGRVIELHLHGAEAIYLTIFPEFLCSLANLEVIRLPNNCIEDIPECIVKLKSLRVFDVSNFDKPRARIPDSIDSFIRSLEHYNEFYR